MTDILTRDYRAVTITVNSDCNLIDEMKKIPGFSLNKVHEKEFYLADQLDGDEIYFRPEGPEVKNIISSNVLGSGQSSGQDHLEKEPEFEKDKVVKLYKAIGSLEGSPLSASLHLTDNDIMNLSQKDNSR